MIIHFPLNQKSNIFLIKNVNEKEKKDKFCKVISLHHVKC